MWWFAALPDFTVFDGGDANPISDISGPMWQQANDSNGNLIAAMFPIPAGTLPSGTVIQIGSNTERRGATHTVARRSATAHAFRCQQRPSDNWKLNQYPGNISKHRCEKFFKWARQSRLWTWRDFQPRRGRVKQQLWRKWRDSSSDNAHEQHAAVYCGIPPPKERKTLLRD